jgi:1,4-dihydroxy-2-naphthoate octaprenyltransferase
MSTGSRSPQDPQIPMQESSDENMSSADPAEIVNEDDPITFFKPHNAGKTAEYAKAQALSRHSDSLVIAWSRAARVQFLPWAVLPVALAAAYTWTQVDHVAWRPLIGLTIAILFVLPGINLLRGAASDTDRGIISKTGLRTYLAARVAIVLLAVGIIVGVIFALPGMNGGGVVLALFGIVLAVGYAFLPGVLGSLPGEELAPAILLGFCLFVIALLTQHPTHVVKVASKTTVESLNLLTPSAWLIALGLTALFLAAGLISHLERVSHDGSLTTYSLLGDRPMRLTAMGSIIFAYLFIFLAGLQKVSPGLKIAPHGMLAVLLSLPYAIVPLTGIMRARNPAALRVLSGHAHQLVIRFALWLLCGIMLGSIYLLVLARIHTIGQ